MGLIIEMTLAFTLLLLFLIYVFILWLEIKASGAWRTTKKDDNEDNQKPH